MLLPGLGAVATTFIAGCMMARRGEANPIGSLTQLGTIRLGKRTDKRVPLIKDFVPLAGLDQLEFAGWDLFPENAFEAAAHAKVLSSEHLAAVRDELSTVTPMSAAFYPEYVKRLAGTHTKKAPSKADMVEALRDDIRQALAKTGAERAVAVWCGSTEIFSRERTGASEHRRVRERPGRKRPRHLEQHALRVGMPQRGSAVRKRCAELNDRFSRRPRAQPRDSDPGLGQGLQDRANTDEDHPRAWTEGANDRPPRLVQHQHPG